MVSKKVIKKANSTAITLKPTVKLKATNDLKPKIKISAIVTQMLHNKIKLFVSRNNLSVGGLLMVAVKK